MRSKTEGRKLQGMPFTPRKSIRRARSFRHEPTEAERILWGYLRNRRLNGHKFVRQEPIGPYFADFLCRERRFIVEVDGATHSEAHEIAHDERRTQYLKAQGFFVLRIQNADVYEFLSDVLDMVLMGLEGKLEPD